MPSTSSPCTAGMRRRRCSIHSSSVMRSKFGLSVGHSRWQTREKDLIDLHGHNEAVFAEPVSCGYRIPLANKLVVPDPLRGGVEPVPLSSRNGCCRQWVHIRDVTWTPPIRGCVSPCGHCHTA